MAIVSSNISSSEPSRPNRKSRVIDESALSDDSKALKEDGLRPHCFEDYIGQSGLKEVLGIAVKAANFRGEALDHVLLHGPPGLGKTTMAIILANELGVKYRVTSAPALERPRDIVGLLINLQPRELLFVDEIHRLPRVAEELLYPAMEDHRLDLTVGKGGSARLRALDLPPFTLVGATTRAGTLSSPLRDRFGITQKLDFYNLNDLNLIVRRAAVLIDLSLTENASIEIARRCRGTPRIANRLLRRVRDFAAVMADQIDLIDDNLVDKALNLHAVDDRGLQEIDRKLLQLILKSHGGGPVGLDTLAAALGEDPTTIEFLVEPFLLQVGFLQRTSRGRVITNEGRLHLSSKENND